MELKKNLYISGKLIIKLNNKMDDKSEFGVKYSEQSNDEKQITILKEIYNSTKNIENFYWFYTMIMVIGIIISVFAINQ